MTVRIALTGTHGVGKTYIVESLAKELEARGHKVAVMPSITRLLKDLGWNNNQISPEEARVFQIVCGALRLVEEKRLLSGNPDVLIADRWVFDELVYGAHLLSKDDISPKHAVLRALRLLVEETLEDWDFIGFKPLHPDFLPESDGHRDPDVEFQKEIEERFKLFISQTPKVSESVKILQKDRDEALEEVLEWCSQKNL